MSSSSLFMCFQERNVSFWLCRPVFSLSPCASAPVCLIWHSKNLERGAELLQRDMHWPGHHGSHEEDGHGSESCWRWLQWSGVGWAAERQYENMHGLLQTKISTRREKKVISSGVQRVATTGSNCTDFRYSVCFDSKWHFPSINERSNCQDVQIHMNFDITVCASLGQDASLLSGFSGSSRIRHHFFSKSSFNEAIFAKIRQIKVPLSVKKFLFWC